MTKEEIRGERKTMLGSLNEVKLCGIAARIERARGRALYEIAAQLAELNESLRPKNGQETALLTAPAKHSDF